MIDHLDHLVLTTVDADACVDFYTRVLGMRLETFAGDRQALRFGQQKINRRAAQLAAARDRQVGALIRAADQYAD